MNAGLLIHKVSWDTTELCQFISKLKAGWILSVRHEHRGAFLLSFSCKKSSSGAAAWHSNENTTCIPYCRSWLLHFQLEAAGDGSSSFSCTWETKIELLAPGFSLVQPWLLWPIEEHTSGWETDLSQSIWEKGNKRILAELSSRLCCQQSNFPSFTCYSPGALFVPMQEVSEQGGICVPSSEWRGGQGLVSEVRPGCEPNKQRMTDNRKFPLEGVTVTLHRDIALAAWTLRAMLSAEPLVGSEKQVEQEFKQRRNWGIKGHA